MLRELLGEIAKLREEARLLAAGSFEMALKVQRRVAELRYNLQRAVSKGASEPTPAMRERFTQLLRDAHAFVNPETSNRSVVDFGRRHTPYEFALYDSEGAKLNLECAIDTLFLLESFFNKDVGTFDSHEKLCYWLRDIFEPNGPGEAPPAPAET